MTPVALWDSNPPPAPNAASPALKASRPVSVLEDTHASHDTHWVLGVSRAVTKPDTVVIAEICLVCPAEAATHGDSSRMVQHKTAIVDGLSVFYREADAPTRRSWSSCGGSRRPRISTAN